MVRAKKTSQYLKKPVEGAPALWPEGVPFTSERPPLNYSLIHTRTSDKGKILRIVHLAVRECQGLQNR